MSTRQRKLRELKAQTQRDTSYKHTGVVLHGDDRTTGTMSGNAQCSSNLGYTALTREKPCGRR